MQKLMGLLDFGKKKEVPQAPTLSEEKKQVSEITAAREALRAAIEKVRLSDPTGQISQEQMEKYATLLAGLRKQLVENVVYGLDTRAIDKELVGFAEQLDVAIGKGHQDTATRIMKGLAYGIQKGHEPIMSSKKDKTAEIMAERMNRLNKYKTIMEYSIVIDDNQDVIKIQNEQREKVKANFAQIQKEVSEQITANPHLVDRINEVGGKVNQAIDPEAFELVVKKQEFNKLYTQIKDLKQQMALKEAVIVNCKSIINSEEAILEEMNNSVDQQMLEDVIRHEAEFRKHLAEVQSQMKELNDLSNRFSYALDEIFSSPLMVDYVLDVDMEFNNIMRKMEEDEEGRRIGLEKLKEMQRENEESQHIMNN